MRKFVLSTVVLCISLMTLHPALAAEESAGFFGIKKFMQKEEPKKTKVLPDQPLKKTASGSSELTDEEKKLVKEMSSKVSDKSNVGDKQDVKIPQTALIVQQVPRTPARAPQVPVQAPKDPNAGIIRIPQAPGKIPGAPAVTAPKAPSAPGSSKK